MCLRWTAAGMLEAEQQFRKIIGFSDLAELAIAVERDVAAKRAAAFTSPSLNAASTRRRRPPLPPSEIIHSRTAVTNFHGERDILRARRGAGRRVAERADRSGQGCL
jgi:hypothetical protein